MLKCSVCEKEDLTVDRYLFDGMCANCTNIALYDIDIYNKAKKNNKILKEFNM